MPTKQSEDSFSMIIDDWNLVYTLYLIIFFFFSPVIILPCKDRKSQDWLFSKSWDKITRISVYDDYNV